MAATRRDTLIGAFATFSLFTVLAGQFWRNLLGYWLLVSFGPMTPAHSIPGTIDRFLLGPKHVYKNGFYDPEGLRARA